MCVCVCVCVLFVFLFFVCEESCSSTVKCMELRSLMKVEGRLGDRKMEVRHRNQSTPVVPRV